LKEKEKSMKNEIFFEPILLNKRNKKKKAYWWIFINFS